MVIFNSYVKLPEGRFQYSNLPNIGLDHLPESYLLTAVTSGNRF